MKVLCGQDCFEFAVLSSPTILGQANTAKTASAGAASVFVTAVAGANRRQVRRQFTSTQLENLFPKKLVDTRRFSLALFWIKFGSWRYSGTSAAATQVAAVASLITEPAKDLTPQQVYHASSLIWAPHDTILSPVRVSSTRWVH